MRPILLRERPWRRRRGRRGGRRPTTQWKRGSLIRLFEDPPPKHLVGERRLPVPSGPCAGRVKTVGPGPDSGTGWPRARAQGRWRERRPGRRKRGRGRPPQREKAIRATTSCPPRSPFGRPLATPMPAARARPAVLADQRLDPFSRPTHHRLSARSRDRCWTASAVCSCSFPAWRPQKPP